MVIDSSAVLAILLMEPDAEHFAKAIEAGYPRLISSATFLEAAMVMERRSGGSGGLELDHLIQRAAIEIVPFDAEQADIARHAFRRYGKGRDRAGLNLGDLFAYALAKATGQPLLYKGGDFAHTDVETC
ncbi:MAG TPA: type II toxin-antitoxin system VapC family toxin [Alphaproteobacteria bacterium]|nr:type II toxin-antitoxin system VapC family toxin [Alphaproteobacteria bacterium]